MNGTLREALGGMAGAEGSRGEAERTRIREDPQPQPQRSRRPSAIPGGGSPGLGPPLSDANIYKEHVYGEIISVFSTNLRMNNKNTPEPCEVEYLSSPAGVGEGWLEVAVSSAARERVLSTCNIMYDKCVYIYIYIYTHMTSSSNMNHAGVSDLTVTVCLVAQT